MAGVVCAPARAYRCADDDAIGWPSPRSRLAAHRRDLPALPVPRREDVRRPAHLPHQERRAVADARLLHVLRPPVAHAALLRARGLVGVRVDRGGAASATSGASGCGGSSCRSCSARSCSCPVLKYVELSSGISITATGAAPLGRPFDESFLAFLPTFYTRMDRFTWSHLWFLLYLFTFSLLYVRALRARCWRSRGRLGGASTRAALPAARAARRDPDDAPLPLARRAEPLRRLGELHLLQPLLHPRLRARARARRGRTSSRASGSAPGRSGSAPRR